MKLARCPCCEALWSAGVTADRSRLTVSWPGGSVRLSRSHVLMMCALLEKPMTRRAMVGVLYADDPRGGPENPHNVLSVQIGNIRRRLAAAGFPGEIVTRHGSGWELRLHAERAVA